MWLASRRLVTPVIVPHRGIVLSDYLYVLKNPSNFAGIEPTKPRSRNEHIISIPQSSMNDIKIIKIY